MGTGEANPRNSVSWGDGVYKSTDGGRDWTRMGLKDSQHIGRIRIDPRNSDVVYVAALGHIWGPNKERGVFKSTDGGLTWTQSLTINADTGRGSIWRWIRAIRTRCTRRRTRCGAMASRAAIRESNGGAGQRNL